MKQLSDYSDARSRVTCTHCGTGLHPRNENKDHVPSRCLLDRPLPEDLPTVWICRSCNASFSKDEEYFFVFLAAVLSGDARPDPSRFPSAASATQRSPRFRKLIARAQIHQLPLRDEPELLWQPDIDRFDRVITKNARGHVLHELGEPVLGMPSRILYWPVSRMSADQRDTFELVSLGPGLPEVGSRMMQRVLGLEPLVNGWVVVQDGVYRYAVVQGSDELLVRTLVRDYLATEVAWITRGGCCRSPEPPQKAATKVQRIVKQSHRCSAEGEIPSRWVPSVFNCCHCEGDVILRTASR